MEQQDLTYWHKLVDKYFEAQTTEEEEALLARFLASDASQADAPADMMESFDEARAVMGIFAMKRKLLAPRRFRLSYIYKGLGWAAVVAIVLVVGLTHNSEKNVYVAYVDGKKVTNKEQVVAIMHQSWNDINYAPTSDNVESTLQDLFDELN